MIVSTDGLFGQCRTSKQDQVKFQVSVPVLKRMQEVLKQLMLQGLSWQDDITQYIVAKELGRVPHTTQSLKDSSFSQTKQSSSNQGGYPSSSSNHGGYPSSSSNQRGYPSSSSNQGGYRSSSSNQGGFPSSSSNQGGYPSSSSNQGGYPSSSSNQGGYPSSSSNQRGYPSSSSNQGGYPSSSSNQRGYPSSSSNQGGYPSSSSNQGGYPSSSSNQGGYPRGYPSSSSNQGGYPSSSSNQRGYPSSSSNQGGYPSSSSNQGGYPSSSSNQGGYPSSSSNQGGYPSSSSNQGGYPSSSSNQGGYPSSSSKSGASQADSHQDYLIVNHLQSPLHMQTSPMDPFTYQQHRYQEDTERSLHQGGKVYAGLRPSSRYQQAKQRERDRQLLQDVISLYLSSSPALPSFRHRGVSALPAPTYYEQPELSLDYVEDYSLTELAMARDRQHQQQQQQLPQQDYSSLAGLDETILQHMVETLEMYGIDPRELTSQQLYRLAVVLQLMQAEDKDNIDPLTDDPKKTQQVLKSSDTVPKKGEKAPVLVPPPSSAPGPKVAPTLAPTATSPPLTAPLGGSVTAKDSSVSVEDVKGKVKSSNVPAGLPAAEGGKASREEYGYIVTDQSPLSLYNGVKLLGVLAERIHLTTSSFINISVVGPALTFRIRQNPQNMSAEDMAEKAASQKSFLESETGLKILQTGVGERSEGHGLPHATRAREGSSGLVLTLVSMACVSGAVVVALTIACLRHHAKQLASGKLGLGPEAGPETHVDYQELCRQHMAAKTSFSRQEAVGGGAGGRRGTDTSRVSSVSSQFSDGPQHSPSSHSSTPSWSEEPAQSNMDISTGHMILAYMEDHLENKDRLMKEWEDLCSYKAEPSAVTVAQSEAHLEKNRSPDSLPYDHSRVKLKAESNSTKEDYINASIIIDHDPRLPAYIATQGPLAHTIADFWQTVWENGCTVIVMITALVEDGEIQCVRYWPDEGSSLYHIYEVNLVSEHIWCKDFLVRSFYLKNVQTQETRTLTQFHLLSWPANGIPTSTRPLLDFRRKVNKCYRGRSCPIIVHCSDGTGRTGTYILIDMVLNRMAKGVKEIDIAATLEHIRDQRPNLVRTKDQFEFALTAVAEEVNVILKALPQ
ncbi:receptor-type tyrosine-protein phosphatase-like N [Salmo salar]|uniref:Receptor-type tyrosine-protein phosphatase-like N n=1 Tax=Salmo salar TaxID=8030 RepID=A0ABM3DX67_SALSA|nr:receptor-type tyrosine-protein phosphatase-like N [Salmo salar]